MNRKTVSVIYICVMLTLVLMTGCVSETTVSTSDDDGIITIAKSEGAKKYEQTLKDDGEKQLLTEENYDTTMFFVSFRGEQEFPKCHLKNKLDCEKVNGSDVYTLTDNAYENIVLYTHGGAWTFGISEDHVTFCDKLADRLNAKVYMPIYPLSPEANSLDTFEVIETLYSDIIDEGKNVYIMGDSAGGEITLGLMYTIKKEGLKAPEKMVLIAPCPDMTFSNKDIDTIAKTDPLLVPSGCRKCGEQWAGKENLKNPKYSALYADVTGYPDTMIFAGTNDILCPDNCLFYEKMKESGVDTTLVKGEGLWHVFPIYPIPEQAIALDLIEEFCAK